MRHILSHTSVLGELHFRSIALGLGRGRFEFMGPGQAQVGRQDLAAAVDVVSLIGGFQFVVPDQAQVAGQEIGRAHV